MSKIVLKIHNNCQFHEHLLKLSDKGEHIKYINLLATTLFVMLNTIKYMEESWRKKNKFYMIYVDVNAL
jgi:hypothetical protein